MSSCNTRRHCGSRLACALRTASTPIVLGRRQSPLLPLLRAGLLGALLLGAGLASGSTRPFTSGPARMTAGGATEHAPTLRVLTLNAAHGRSNAFNQLFLTRDTVRRNLRNMASVLEREAPDLVALQEADGPSRWSGRFDHVRLVAEQAGFPWRFRGAHAEGWLFHYGTALLARRPLEATRSFRFDPTPPTPRKGFVIGELAWPESPGTPAVDVVSVHFDYLSRAARQQQYEQLAAELILRARPVIVLGDFNSDWNAPDSPVRRLAARVGLETYEPDDRRLATHPDGRIDWILISSDFRFDRYEVLPDLVSDHLAIVAEISPRRPRLTP